MEKDGRLVNRAPAPQVPDRKTNHIQNSQIAQILDPTSEQLDSIKKYQVSFFSSSTFYSTNKNECKYMGTFLYPSNCVIRKIFRRPIQIDSFMCAV